ncbi:ankyrin repeat domain-containing protein, partial [Candidatus Dependentiae bacterium]|nr:ankyrin repeat domain-containing protein [Candidatus Dependentiae bacterium]
MKLFKLFIIPIFLSIFLTQIMRSSYSSIAHKSSITQTQTVEREGNIPWSVNGILPRTLVLLRPDLNCIKKLSSDFALFKDPSSDSLLHAVKSNNTHLVKLLLTRLMRLEEIDLSPTLLSIAAANKNKEIINLLLKKQFDQLEKDLIEAFSTGKVEEYHLEKIASWILTYGDINALDSNSKSLLNYAIEECNDALLYFLIKSGLKFQFFIGNGMTRELINQVDTFNEAFTKGQSLLAKKLVACHTRDLFSYNNDLEINNSTLLEKALKGDNPYMIYFLIKRGALFKAYTKADNLKLLNKGIELISPWLVKEILKTDLNSRLQDPDLSPLQKAIEVGSSLLDKKSQDELKDIVEYLFEKGAFIKDLNQFKQAPAYIRQLQLQQAVLSSGLNPFDSGKGFGGHVNQLDEWYSNYVEEYAFKSAEVAVPKLYKDRDDLIEDEKTKYWVNLQNVRNSTITSLHVLASIPDGGAMPDAFRDQIRKNGITVNSINALTYNKLTPLHIALTNKNLSLATKLVMLGADVTIENDQGITPLDLIYMTGNAGLARWLDENKDIRPSMGRHVPGVGKLFYWLAEHGYVNLVEIMLNGTKISHYSDTFSTYNIYNGLTRKQVNEEKESWQNTDSYGKTTSYNKDTNQYTVNEPHTTALHLAANNYHKAVVEVLLSNDIPLVDPVNERRQTPLHILMEKKISNKEHIDKALAIARLLINKGADINAQDSYKKTPLHYAVASGCLLKTVLLLKAGADINVQDEYDETPFNLAIRRKNGEMVKALLEANPDL